MTTADIETERFRSMDNNSLIELGANTQDEIDILSKRFSRIKYILRQRLLDNNAKSFLHPNIECKGRYNKNDYNYDKLILLKEVLDEDQLGSMYTPQHIGEVTVKENWDMRKVKGLKQFGQEFADMIEEATIEGELIDITFKRKSNV